MRDRIARLSAVIAKSLDYLAYEFVKQKSHLYHKQSNLVYEDRERVSVSLLHLVVYIVLDKFQASLLRHTFLGRVWFRR